MMQVSGCEREMRIEDRGWRMEESLYKIDSSQEEKGSDGFLIGGKERREGGGENG